MALCISLLLLCQCLSSNLACPWIFLRVFWIIYWQSGTTHIFVVFYIMPYCLPRLPDWMNILSVFVFAWLYHTEGFACTHRNGFAHWHFAHIEMDLLIDILKLYFWVNCCAKVIIIIIIVIMSVFLERLSMWNMLICSEKVQIQKYKTHAYRTLKTAGVQTVILKHPIALKRCKYKNTKHMHIRHPKQQVSKQSYSNIQLLWKGANTKIQNTCI